ncbi:MAG: TetR/AcrR family transcriptional regulator [Planctomycetota bacterium]
MPKSWRTDAQQARSRETDRRIVAAAFALIGKHGFVGVPVGRVAKAAGVSIGGLYARYANKHVLVHAVDERLGREFEAALNAAMDPERLAGRNVAGVIEAYVTAMVRFFAKRRAIVRQVVLRARTSEDGLS